MAQLLAIQVANFGNHWSYKSEVAAKAMDVVFAIALVRVTPIIRQ
jgi:hypothetical protein